MKKIHILFVVFGFICVSLFIANVYSKKETVIENLTEKPTKIVISSATFVCSENKKIQATFFKEKVSLVTDGGKTFSLPQVISGSGARYANTDESFIFWNKGNTAFVEEKGVVTFKDCVTENKKENNPPVAQMGNPASINCTKVGGTLTIEKREDGGEYGLCHFEENRACEEWTLMRGDCPLGGRKTTGYDTIDQKFCVWLGGETLAVKNSQCTFKNGKVCSTKDFYEGKCDSSL